MTKVDHLTRDWIEHVDWANMPGREEIRKVARLSTELCISAKEGDP